VARIYSAFSVLNNRQNGGGREAIQQNKEKIFVTYFSLAWASEGTVDPFPFAYMLKVAELSCTCQIITDDTDPVAMTIAEETCGLPRAHWSAKHSSCRGSRDRAARKSRDADSALYWKNVN
jgi:hypothetical protein